MSDTPQRSTGIPAKQPADPSQPGCVSVATQTVPEPGRISKGDLFAIMALWMERCPLNGENPPQQPQPDSGQFGVSKAGAVFVDANDRVVAMDCSRWNHDETIGVSFQVHAAARVIANFPDKVKGCTVYMSRRPCSYCVKLLVQAQVLRICFLPLQPEASPEGCTDLENAKRTENLVRVCPVGLSVYVPELDDEAIDLQSESFIRMEEEYWSKIWVQKLKEMKEGSDDDIMRCSGLPDSKAMETTRKSIMRIGKWIGRVTCKLKNSTEFELFNESPEHPPSPDVYYLHMSIMALIASQRSDDPTKKGVGVIILMKKQVASVGMSGYPSKALFGDFPRKNPRSKESPKKFPFLVHAEQNALLLRNTRMIADESTAFITRPPCDHCMSLLLEAGVKKIVLPLSKEDCETGKEGNDMFLKLYKKNKILAFGIIQTYIHV